MVLSQLEAQMHMQLLFHQTTRAQPGIVGKYFRAKIITNKVLTDSIIAETENEPSASYRLKSTNEIPRYFIFRPKKYFS